MASKSLKDAEFVKPPEDSDFDRGVSDADFSDIAAQAELINEPRPSSGVMDYLGQGLERAAVKNFGTDPYKAAEWLQARNPDTKVSVENGDIYFEKDGKKYPLDPKGLDIGDIGDIPYDIAAGLGTTVATGAAGLAGAGAGGIGALPAAAAGGAFSSAGLEALRQKIGQMIGVNEGEALSTDIPDPMGVGISGATGGLSPLLFGTGATAGQIAKNATARGLTDEAVKDTQKGLISRAFPAALSKMSGITKDTIKKAQQELPKIKALEKSLSPTLTLGEEVMSDVDKLEGAKRVVGKQIENVHNAITTVPVEIAKQPILDDIAKYESIAQTEGLSKSEGETLKALKDLLADTFTGDFASGKKAMLLKEQLKNASESNANQTAANAAKRSLGVLSKVQKKISPELKDLNPQYEEIDDLLGKITRSTEDPHKAWNFLRTIGTKSKEPIGEMLEKSDDLYGTNLNDKAHMIAAFDIFRKGKPLELGWSALKQRSGAEATGAGIGGVYGYKEGGYPGLVAGMAAGGGLGALGGSPQALRFYLDMANKGGRVSPYVRPGVQSVWNLMQQEGK